ncbi:hypothetical protein G7Z17_g6218 [Cylindrodendrum hubeiense]|uniref:Zn(2)-C6 fungal-type domain-containing protein n=1 Tax=Cylindrodendrum hubeiense TaxID=595255 RepID=A0A9P5H7N9_9HYPO|nr:hypothetical protein G7Z17_g6218 [Cylindrodendrum hubeiense]
MDQGQMRKLAQILPAPAINEESSSTDSSTSVISAAPRASKGAKAPAKPKRAVVGVACVNCRRRKAKCNSARPSCGHCLKRQAECIYSDDKTEVVSLDLKRKHTSIELENTQYRELFILLRDKPEGESDEIFRRLRVSSDPLRVLEAIKQAELLLPNPASNERLGNAQLMRYNAVSLRDSAIKVHARPWTTVVDDGLLSELLTNLFVWDGMYCFPSIDLEAFLEDMKSGDVEKAKWCSPLLVNAICALRCHFSERAKLFGIMTRQNLSDRFMDEAKGFLSRENGRASIPTVQALVFMYLATATAGRDRAARVYRFTAFTLLRRLRLEQRFRSLSDSEIGDAKERRVISCAVWGLFAMESRIALYYSQPSILPAPNVPKLLTGYKTMHLEEMENVDVLGQPLQDKSSQIPLVPGTSILSCELSEMWNELMHHTTSGETIRGSDADIRVRKAFYSRLRRFREELPSRFDYEKNLTPSTCFLRMHENEVIYTTLQHLPLDTPFETQYGSPKTTVKDILLQTCRDDTVLAEVYLRKWPFGAMITRVIILTMQNLIPLLDDPASHDLFIRDSIMARLSTRATKLAGRLVQAVQALAWAMKKPIPEAARPYFEDWGPEAVEKDLPIAFVLPQLEDIKGILTSDGEADTAEVEGQLAFLIEKWAKM